MVTTPMFPLGSVLLPYMPLPLRLFEQRYLMMLGQLLERPEPEFGVVLIERGPEVGGGEQRFDIGTMAGIIEVRAQAGFVAVAAQGGTRFRVERWLDDDPYPRADVVALEEFDWDDDLSDLRSETEAQVREALRLRGQFEDTWRADIELAADPIAACWQLAGVTPVGSLDRLTLLRADSAAELLTMTGEFARESAETAALLHGDG